MLTDSKYNIIPTGLFEVLQELLKFTISLPHRIQFIDCFRYFVCVPECFVQTKNSFTVNLSEYLAYSIHGWILRDAVRSRRPKPHHTLSSWLPIALASIQSLASRRLRNWEFDDWSLRESFSRWGCECPGFWSRDWGLCCERWFLTA